MDSNLFTEQDFIDRLSPFARDGRAAPRPFSSPNRGAKTSNKYSRYRQKCISEGGCPHCGKPCAPFFECAERRAFKLMGLYLRKLIKDGEITVVGEVVNGKRITYQKTVGEAKGK